MGFKQSIGLDWTDLVEKPVIKEIEEEKKKATPQEYKQTIGKVPLSNLLHFRNALEEVSRVREFGNIKYPDPLSYKKVPNGLLTDALIRHLFEAVDEDNAEDSDCDHLAHLIVNALMILEKRLAE